MKYRDFWPYYLSEHKAPLTRRLHFVGTLLVFVFFFLGLFQSPYWFFGMPLGGYFFAWMSHFLVEKNKPATFRYPFLSLLGDFHMFFLMLFRRL